MPCQRAAVVGYTAGILTQCRSAHVLWEATTPAGGDSPRVAAACGRAGLSAGEVGSGRNAKGLRRLASRRGKVCVRPGASGGRS